MTSSQHVYEVRPRKDKRGVDLISDVLPFGRLILIALILTAFALGGCNERKGELSGEVFIVTKGGHNYKLGLVPIALYSLETLKPYLDQKEQQAQTELARLGPLAEAAKSEMDAKDKAKAAAFDVYLKGISSEANKSVLEAAHNQADKRWQAAMGAYYSLLDEQSKFVSGAFYFDGLPKPLVTTQTNSDGRFTIEMPTKGDFAIAANAYRTVGDSTEHYYWLIKVSLDGAAKKAIMLSNNNLTSEGSSDSLIGMKLEGTHSDKQSDHQSKVSAVDEANPATPKLTQPVIIQGQYGNTTLPIGTEVELVSQDAAYAHIRYAGREFVIPNSAVTQSK